MDYAEIREQLISAILDLEASCAKYAIFTMDDDFIAIWENSRNEYMSLLTRLLNFPENNRRD